FEDGSIRGGDLALEPHYRAGTEADQLGGLQDAGALGELGASSRELFLRWAGAAKAGAHDAGLLADEFAVAGELVLDGLHAGAHPGLDNGAFEFAEGTRDLEQQSTHRRGRVDVLLIEVKVNTGGFEVLDRAQEVNQRPAKPINGPGHHHVELAPAGIL